MYIGDFNARNSEWWNGDSTELAELVAQYNLNQVTDGPTHILRNSVSCIDLMFTTETNFVTDLGVLPLLFPRCHHQLIFAKVGFTAFFPHTYKQRIWDFSKANINAMRQAVSCVDWDRAFSGLNIDERVKFLTECVLNVFYNFVPNKVITIKSKDTLWITSETKRMVLEKAKICWHYIKHGQSIVDYQILRDITSKCKNAIKEAKTNYFSCLGESLNDPAITPKKYWSILHSFLCKHKIPKIPLIRHNSTFLTDVMVKANTFNSFFAKQCSLIETGSELPADYLLTHHHLESVNLDPAKKFSII